MPLTFDATCPKCEKLVSMVVKVKMFGIAFQEGASSIEVKPDPRSMEVIGKYELIACVGCGKWWVSLEALAKDLLKKIKEEHGE